MLRAVVARKRDENRDTEPRRALAMWKSKALAGKAVIGP
jgi:hypothetical protein